MLVPCTFGWPLSPHSPFPAWGLLVYVPEMRSLSSTSSILHLQAPRAAHSPAPVLWPLAIPAHPPLAMASPGFQAEKEAMGRKCRAPPLIAMCSACSCPAVLPSLAKALRLCLQLRVTSRPSQPSPSRWLTGRTELLSGWRTELTLWSLSLIHHGRLLPSTSRTTFPGASTPPGFLPTFLARCDPDYS